MKELGRLLQEKREQLGMDLDELQTRTKIRKRYLKALEEGDWSILPGDVYARGFVRSYAEIVGLDGKELLDKYVENRSISPEVKAEQDHESAVVTPNVIAERTREETQRREAVTPRPTPTRPQALRVPPTRRQKPRRGSGTIGQAAAVVAALVVLGGVWWSLGSHPDKSVANLSNPSAIGGNGVTPTGGNSNSPQASTGTGDNNTPSTQPGSPPQPPVQVVAQPFQNNLQTYTVTTTQPINVVLSAQRDDCWVKVTADGKVIDASDTMVKGQTKTWQANHSLLIRVGNVPAVTLTINGQVMALPNTSTAIDVQVVKAQT